MEAPSDDKKLYLKVLRILIRRGWRMYLSIKRYRLAFAIGLVLAEIRDLSRQSTDDEQMTSRILCLKSNNILLGTLACRILCYFFIPFNSCLIRSTGAFTLANLPKCTDISLNLLASKFRSSSFKKITIC
jgi:hypothetical protein